MTEENAELARRLVSCKGWRWMPGMLTMDDERVLGIHMNGALHLCDFLYDLDLKNFSKPRIFFDTSGSCLPDLTDAATLGCLLALVRELHQQSSLSPIKIGRDRWCLADYGTTALDGDTEAALLVAALEAAP